MKFLYKKIERFIPAIAFFGGFTWDSITLGSLVQSSDLLILFCYYFIAFIFLIFISAKIDDTAFGKEKYQNAFFSTLSIGRHRILSKSISEKWKDRLTYALQFCFGSLYSALVVFYFKSSGTAGAFVLVFLLLILLVSNEFLKKNYASFGFSLALFSLLGTMFLNFLIPHIVGSISFFWFLISVLLSLFISFIAFRLSHHSKKNFITPVLVSVFLILAYLANWIPPVPLVPKEEMPCVRFYKNYSCFISKPDVFMRTSLKDRIVYLENDDSGVYFLSSVFAPEKISVQLEHRWFLKNPETGDFELKSVITSERMQTNGSRKEGFRIYSRKKNVPYGKWKVETAIHDGKVISSKTFDVKQADKNAPERILWKMN